MDNTSYCYKGKLWNVLPTTSDTNNFFHAAFGMRKTENEAYFDKHAQFRRLRWAAFLTYFENETMPPRLAEVLTKCLSTVDKHEPLSVNDKENMHKYVTDIIASKRNVTAEEIRILATLENVRIVVLSSRGPDATITVKPNLSILGSYPNAEIPKEEVVLCLEGDVFSKLESINAVEIDVTVETAKKNVVQSEHFPVRYKKGSSAGSKGVQYQINLLVVVLLNVFKNLREWKLSTENEDAGKFDDIVLEQSGGGTFIQSKHKESSNKKITLEELTSTNSKNDDFSLPKYFLSYQLLKDSFNVKNVIICTNADVNEKALRYLDRHELCCESVLHYDDSDYFFYTLNEDILPGLKENIKDYYKQNFKGKGIAEFAINDEDLKDFQGHLQLYFNYPSLNRTEKIIDKSLSYIKCCNNPRGKIYFSEIYSKVMDWFQRRDGIYFTQVHTKAVFSEIWRDKYCQRLAEYNVSFQKNDLNFQGPKQIFHVISKNGYLLQIIKIYRVIQNDKMKILIADRDDELDIQKQVVEAFELPQYTFLIIIWAQTIVESVTVEITRKLKNTLQKYAYKKIIMVAENNSRFCQQIGLRCDIIHDRIVFDDLDMVSQGMFLKKSTVFQGKRVNVEEILKPRTKTRPKVLNMETLEKLVKGEEIKVGAPLSGLDEYISRYYVNRTFKRELVKTQNKNCNNKETNNILLNEMQSLSKDGAFRSYKKLAHKQKLISKQCKILNDEIIEEIFSEESIYNVTEKVVVIADSAGTGKSTALTNLSVTIKEKSPHLWVIRIDLNNYTRILKDFLEKNKKSINITELLNSKDETKLTNSFQRCLFSTTRKVVLLLDGVDEISPDYTVLILGLLQQCQKQSNFDKIFVTTRPHLAKELEAVLQVKSFILQPFTEQNQVDFLSKYWIHNLELKNDVIKGRCKRYAIALIKKWANLDSTEGNHFATVPLQVRMMAEIFQENTRSSEWTGWEGCKEYVMGEEVEPNISEILDITKLYDLFIKKKQNIFIEKENPSGNVGANHALKEQFNESLAHHRSLALEMILGEDVLHIFPSYRRNDKTTEIKMLKIGIVQKLNEKLHFIHRTFADFFVSECLLTELQNNQALEFQIFFIDTILLCPQYNVTRIFFDSLLQNTLDSLPYTIFEKFQSLEQGNVLDTYLLQSNLLHILAKEGCVSILQLVLKCINFETIRNKGVDISNAYQTEINMNTGKNIFGNTLNVLQHLTKQAGINIKDKRGYTPLHFAAENGHSKMMKFLVEKGANIDIKTNSWQTALHLASNHGNLDITEFLLNLGVDPNVRDDDGFTALHSAAYSGQLNTVKFFVKYGLDFNVTCNNGCTLLHSAGKTGHLNTVKYLLEVGVDFKIRNRKGFTALHLAASCGKLDIVKFFVEYGLDFNVTNNCGYTLLHSASEDGYLDIVKYLLELGVNFNIRDNDGFTALQIAAYFGQLNTVKFLVGNGLDFNVTSDEGSTLLHSASEGGHLDIVKYLLEIGVNFNITDNDGYTALHIAAYNGHLDTAKFLMGNCLDFNVTTNNGSTLLHLASENGHLDTVKYLLELGLDFSIKDNDGFTVLQTAAYYGQLDIVKYLVEYGLDFSVISDYGSTLLHSASENGHLGIMKYLLELGLDFNIKDNDGFTILQTAAYYGQLNIVKLLVEYGLDIKVTSNSGSTLLHSASVNGHLDTVKYLLEVGVDYNIRSNNGFTALHSASLYGHLDAVKFLIEYGLDFNVTSNDGLTPLHAASQNGHLDTVKYLLHLGLDINIRDNDGFTVLQTAAYYGQLNIVKLLVEYGLDFKVISNRGSTLLHSASMNGHLGTVKYLLEVGVDFKIRSSFGFTALHFAARYGQLDTTKFLVKYGLDFNVTSNDGYTLLHSASEEGHLDTVIYLLECGVDFNIRDNHGFTALHLAIQCGQLDIVKFLIEHCLDFGITSSHGYRSLHLASANSHLDTVKYLLEVGVDYNTRDDRGFTALHLVNGNNQSKIIRLFMEYGQDINLKSSDGFTLLHIVSADGNLDTVKSLLDLNADFSVRDNNDFTPLHLAAKWGHLDTIKFFVEYGLDYNATTNHGQTLLHLSSEAGHLDVVKYLLELDVDCNVRNSVGYTALHLAAQEGHKDIVRSLVEYGVDLNIKDNKGCTALNIADIGDHLETFLFLMENETDSEHN